MSNSTNTSKACFSTSFRVHGSIAALAFFICLCVAQNTFAANFVVTRNDDRNTTCNSGVDCSLREAVNEANAAATNDTVSFVAGLQTITLTNEIIINNNGTLSITGNGANVLTIDGGAGTNRIFYTNNATLTITGVTLTGGNGTGATASGSGGAIYADGGTLVLDGVSVTANTVTPQFTDGGGVYFAGGSNHQIINSTFSGNSTNLSGNCGGFFNSGTLTVTNSTISGNTAIPTGNGGGLGGGFCSSNNTTLQNVTVFGNSGGNGNVGGSGIQQNGGMLNLANSLVAGNTAGGNSPHDIFISNGAVTTSGYNLIGNNSSVETTFPAGNPNANNDIVGTSALPVNPRLVPLGNYGGATFTHALLQDSPALDAGSNCVLTANGCGNGNVALSFDQRGTGAPRQIGASVDIGAYERNITFSPSTLPNGNTGAPYNQTLTATRETSFAEFSSYEQKLESPAAPFTFTIIPIAGQQLPPGLSLASNGTISGTPTQTGTFTFTVKAADADTMAGAQEYTIQITAPTAASVSVSGRVLTPTGRGLTNAVVILTNSNGETHSTRTTEFGYYRFDEVAAGETYVISVSAKRYQFEPQVMSLNENTESLDFTATDARKKIF